MSRIWASLKKRLYTTHESVAMNYRDRTGDPIIQFNMAKIKPSDVAPISNDEPKVLAWAIVSETVWQTVMDTPNQLDLWIQAGFDVREFEEHRLSIDKTKAIFRIDIFRQVVKDRLDQWITAGFIDAYYPYNHQEYNEDGDPVDTTIKEFLNGNPEWETEEV